MPNLKNNSGFTLIELIIVVAIIGVLATAVLSGTDFLDQRNQAADVGNYNIARNLQAAYEQLQIQNSALTLTSGQAVDNSLQLLKTANILKSSFTIPGNTFYIFVDNTTKEIAIDFELQSKKYLNSIVCDNVATAATRWRVPGCGQLR